jgi:hypothetical protein
MGPIEEGISLSSWNHKSGKFCVYTHHSIVDERNMFHLMHTHNWEEYIVHNKTPFLLSDFYSFLLVTLKQTQKRSMDHLKQGRVSILRVPDLSGRPATTCVSSSSSPVALYCAQVENPLHWCQFLIVSITCTKNSLLMQNPQLQGPWGL